VDECKPVVSGDGGGGGGVGGLPLKSSGASLGNMQDHVSTPDTPRPALPPPPSPAVAQPAEDAEVSLRVREELRVARKSVAEATELSYMSEARATAAEEARSGAERRANQAAVNATQAMSEVRTLKASQQQQADSVRQDMVDAQRAQHAMQLELASTVVGPGGICFFPKFSLL
jgi:hypothetical protein